MFWVLLIGMSIGTIFLNLILVNQVWYKWYPIQLGKPIGDCASEELLMTAQLKAIML